MKCQNKCNSKRCLNNFCDSNLKHLNRIEGQIKKLKEYIENGESCKNIAMLTKSISNSFESLKNRTMKNFILNEFGKNISEEKIKNIDEIFESYGK